MLLQQDVYLGERGEGAIQVGILLESLRHIVADCLPNLCSHFFSNAAISDNFDLAIRHVYIDKHAAIFFGIPNPVLSKQGKSAFAGSNPPQHASEGKRWLYNQPYFCAMLAFPFGNSLFYHLQRCRWKCPPS